MTAFGRELGAVSFFVVVILTWLAAHAVHAADLLDPEDAFRFSAAVVDDGAVEAHFSIADGYYLYQERFAFAASDEVQLGAPQYPPAKTKFDETFGRNVLTYRGDTVVRLPAHGNGTFTLTARFQGCADQGVCYPPQERATQLTLAAAAEQPQPPATGTAASALRAFATADLSRLGAALQSRSLIMVLPIFFVLGLLLSFTPCVLPMVPILSSIIVGQSGPRESEAPAMTRTRGFLLSAAYVLGMAAVYTALGVVAGLVGEGVAGILQQPWVLVLFAALLVALALSMFGFYELQLPSAWQTRVAAASARIPGGALGSVFAMGAVSTAVVGPCVAPPLAGALLYISQTNDVVTGGSALFAMAAGMGVPLLLLGVSAGSLLPRASRWMESVKRLFGALLLAVALWMISPVIPIWTQMLAWGALAIIGAAYLRVFDALPPEAASGWQRLWKGVGVLLLVAGTLQIVGVASGAGDVLHPLERLALKRADGDMRPTTWSPVATVDQLDAALRAGDKPVLVDFYADWCVSCKEMERLTFADPRVAAELAGFRLLRADITASNDQDRMLLKRFRLFGPPATLFFDRKGREIPAARVIGYEPANRFLVTLMRADEAMRPRSEIP